MGDASRHGSSPFDTIVDAELDRALADPDPLRGIARLTARWAAAVVLDPAAVTRTKALGSESMARKLSDALPGGEGALRATVWEFMRPSSLLASLRSTATCSLSTRASRRPSTSTTTARRPTPASQIARPHSHWHTNVVLPPGNQAPGGRTAGTVRPRVPPLAAMVGPARQVASWWPCRRVSLAGG